MKSKISERLSDVHELSRKELIQRAKNSQSNSALRMGKNFRLKDFDPKEDAGLGPEDKPLAKKTLQLGVDALSTMQEVLYAQDKWAVLLIFQAMDAAGKGRSDPACDVWRESPGLPGYFLQSTFGRRAGS